MSAESNSDKKRGEVKTMCRHGFHHWVEVDDPKKDTEQSSNEAKKIIVCDYCGKKK